MSKDKKKQNKQNLLEFINPALEYIFNEILKSRIKKISEKSLMINYETKENKLINIAKEKNPNKPNIYEYNIYIFFCEEERKYLQFIVENWKFKINTENSELNELDNNSKKIIQKKLLTFIRSIKTTLFLLPLNSLVQDVENKNFDFTFEAQLYKESNIDMGLENEIIQEKKEMKINMISDKFFDISLTINYITKNGIFKHQDNLKLKNVNNYKEYYSEYYGKKMNQRKNSKFSKINTINEKDNTNININKDRDVVDEEDNNKPKKEFNPNLSLLFEEVANKDELMFSNIIENTIINNDDLNDNKIKQITKEINYNKNINLEKLYSSCFDNLEEIDCQKNEDDILDIDTLMKKEKRYLNDIKLNYKYNIDKTLVDEVYDEMDGFEISNLLKYPTKIKKKIEVNNYKDIGFRDLMEDYFTIKHFSN